MFSDGQWIFAGLFAVAFVVIIAISYRKDLKLHKKYYKGSLNVLLGFLIFIAFLFVIKTYLR